MKRTIVIAIAALMLAGCGNNNASKTGDNTAAQGNAPAAAPVKASVKVQPAEKEEISIEGTYSATIQANIVNNIAPQAGGRIQKINVEVGDFVSRGQVLATMDQSQLEQAKLRLSNAETELGRMKELYGQGALAQSDYEAAELAYNVSKSAYDNLLENTILRSPITGVVTARNYDRGDMYTMVQPLFTVQQIVPVKMLVGVSETDYTKVKKGDKVSLTVDALPGKSFSGTVVRLYPTVDAATHTFNVEVQVPNRDRVLRPGMFARATIAFGKAESIVVPDAAVVKMQGSGQRRVFVFEDGVAVEKIVALGRHFDGKYEITGGLEEGEQIIVKGQNSLRNGVEVEVIE